MAHGNLSALNEPGPVLAGRHFPRRPASVNRCRSPSRALMAVDQDVVQGCDGKGVGMINMCLQKLRQTRPPTHSPPWRKGWPGSGAIPGSRSFRRTDVVRSARFTILPWCHVRDLEAMQLYQVHPRFAGGGQGQGLSERSSRLILPFRAVQRSGDGASESAATIGMP
jgi:hypothetical protein